MPSTKDVAVYLFQKVTEGIIARNGYQNIVEFEYEMAGSVWISHLDIWIGRGRRQERNHRRIELTDKDKETMLLIINKMRA